MSSATELALNDIPALTKITDAGMKKLAKLADLVSAAEGTLLFSEGEQHDRIYFVRTGAIKLEMVTTNCGRQTILTAGNGDLLAWSALLGNQIMTASAIAAEDTSLVAFNADELRQAADGDHEFGYQIMQVVAKSLSRRLLATRLQLLDLFHP